MIWVSQGFSIYTYNQKPQLIGEVLVINLEQINVLLMNFISVNGKAETKGQSINNLNNRRHNYITPREHYEGVQVFAVDISKADLTLYGIFYSGGKPPHMGWFKSERHPTYAFDTYGNHKARKIHSYSMRLRLLLGKVNAELLT